MSSTTLPTPTRLAYNRAEAAELLGVSLAFFDEHVAPEIRIVAAGRRRLVPVGEVEQWLRRRGPGLRPKRRRVEPPPPESNSLVRCCSPTRRCDGCRRRRGRAILALAAIVKWYAPQDIVGFLCDGFPLDVVQLLDDPLERREMATLADLLAFLLAPREVIA